MWTPNIVAYHCVPMKVLWCSPAFEPSWRPTHTPFGMKSSILVEHAHAATERVCASRGTHAMNPALVCYLCAIHVSVLRWRTLYTPRCCQWVGVVGSVRVCGRRYIFFPPYLPARARSANADYFTLITARRLDSPLLPHLLQSLTLTPTML